LPDEQVGAQCSADAYFGLNAYFGFVAAYRNAAEKLRAGQRDAPFPTGCFPPPLPFVSG
jgi:hypothetical protein